MTSVKGTLGANIENMVLSLKRAHTNTMQTQNDLLLQFLSKMLQEIAKKGGSSSPLSKLLGSNAELSAVSPSKSILKLLTQAICLLATPTYQPSYPASKLEI